MPNLNKEQLNNYFGEEEAKKYYKDLEKYNAGKRVWVSFEWEALYSTAMWSIKKRAIDVYLLMFLFFGILAIYYSFEYPAYALPLWGKYIGSLLLTVLGVGTLISSNSILLALVDSNIKRGITELRVASKKSFMVWGILFYLPVVVLLYALASPYVKELSKPFDQKSHDAFEKALSELERPNPLQVLATGYRRPKEYKEAKWYDFRWGKPLPYDFVLQKGVKRNFIDNNDSTITDKSLGLMWQDNRGVLGEHRDDEIDSICSRLKLGDYKDWRVPTAYELMSLLDFNKDKIVDNPFKYGYEVDTTYGYWSSTFSGVKNEGYIIFIFYGDVGFYSVNNRKLKKHLRCIRSIKKQKPLRLYDFIEDINRQVVLDIGTSLMWQNELYSKYAVWTENDNRNYSRRREFGKLMTQEHALEYCEDLKLGGYDDWYLPNMQQRIQLNSFLNYPNVKTPFTKIPAVQYEKEKYDRFIHESTRYSPNSILFVRCVREAKVWKWDEE